MLMWWWGQNVINVMMGSHVIKYDRGFRCHICVRAKLAAYQAEIYHQKGTLKQGQFKLISHCLVYL